MRTGWRGHTVVLPGRLSVVRRLSCPVLLLALTVGVAASGPRLVVVKVGSSLAVTFDLQPERVDDLSGRLRSGAPVSVTWDIDVRREVAFWLDRDVERFSLVVTARATADRERFAIVRTLNKRVLGDPILATLDEAYRHLTAFDNVELPYAAPAAASAPARLAIKASLEGGGAARIATLELARTVIEP